MSGNAAFPSVTVNRDVATFTLNGKRSGKSSIVRVPADFVPLLRTLWPFYEKKGRLFKSIGKRDVMLHHILLMRDKPELTPSHLTKSRARDGDFLNLSANNIYLPFDRDANTRKVSPARARFIATKQLCDSLLKWVPEKCGKVVRYVRRRNDIDPELQFEWEVRLAEDTTLYEDAEREWHDAVPVVSSIARDDNDDDDGRPVEASSPEIEPDFC